MRLETVRSPQQACLIARAALQSWRPLLAAGLCSGAVNVLALTGPIYMLVIYNGVLPSGSGARLAALSAIMLGLYAVSGLLDHLRTRLMSLAGLRIDRRVSEGNFAIQQHMALSGRCGDGLQPMRDLDQIRALLSSAAPTALFDLPWMPLYLCVIYALHPLLGALAGAGALLLVGLMLLAERTSGAAIAAASLSAGRRWSFAAAAHRNAGAARAMGLNRNLQSRWNQLNALHREAEQSALRRASCVTAAIKVARPALQSGTLGLGAYLFLEGQASAGAMVAASIILSRALAPVETAIAHWRTLGAAHQSYRRLNALFASLPLKTGEAPQIPPPRNSLTVEHLSAGPPGEGLCVIHEIAFNLEAGDGLGIVGPSGSGKSTLARALVGVWAPLTGAVRLDGNALSSWDGDSLGSHIGYMPQEVELFAGSIADNIARFDPQASDLAIVSAARAAGVHEMILRLKDGYATDIGAGGAVLSAGQRQRIALARALYGEPFLVVLDEPNANLDSEGDACLTQAIASVRSRGGIVVVVAHRRPALIAVDQVLALANGRMAAFGAKDAVLQRVLHARVAPRATHRRQAAAE